MALYNAAGGASWVYPDGANAWDTNTDPCPPNPSYQWHGCACVDPCYTPIDGEDCQLGRITGITLTSMGLVGTIPDSTFDTLTNLTIFDVSFNSLSGTLPTQIGKLRNVQIFQVRDNQLSGTIPTEIRTMGSHVAPDELAMALEDYEALVAAGELNETAGIYPEDQEAMGLSQFDISHNRFNGTIPTTIGELINLQAVDVSHNTELGADGCCDNADSYYSSFYGYTSTIPTEMGQLKKLQVLKMDFSRFMRHLPSEIGMMRSLQFWRMKGTFDTNQVSGTIPSQFGKLKKLTEFFVENNTLSGTIPSEIGGMTKIEMFSAQDNKLSGTIPDIFDSIPALSLWDTFGNKLYGDLPPSIESLGSLNYLYIQNEHTDPLRNHFCKQRIEESANGRKHNWQVLGTEYFSYKKVSACANPYDLAGAFDRLSGDV